ncbi:MAG: hypothetical protein ACK4IY_00730 [Chitinophagales bacterium]
MMKKFILIACMIQQTMNIQSQSVQYTGGGYGNFFVGPSYLSIPTLHEYLKEEQILGASASYNAISTMIGGEGFGMKGRFIIGGGGFGSGPINVASPKGKAEINAGGGYFKTGYVLIPGKAAFFATHLGIGWGGYSVKITNNTPDQEIYFNPAKPAIPLDIRNYYFGGTIFDPGVSVQTIAFGDTQENSSGGFMLGIHMGCIITIPLGDWYSGTDMVLGYIPLPGVLYNPYLKITIGGGGMEYKTY